jgi:hypothetical protein
MKCITKREVGAVTNCVNVAAMHLEGCRLWLASSVDVRVKAGYYGQQVWIERVKGLGWQPSAKGGTQPCEQAVLLAQLRELFCAIFLMLSQSATWCCLRILGWQ